MPTVLIIESNTPDMVAAGQSAARPFVACFSALAPGLQARVAAPYAQPVHADQLKGCQAVVFTGSGVGWGVDAPQAAPLRAAFDLVAKAGLPMWGSCNGLQLAAFMLGGAVGPSDRGVELGLARDMRLSDAGRTHPAMAGRENGFSAPCIHRDEVTALPPAMVVLASNAHSHVQMAVCEGQGVQFWGSQYHPELSLADIADYLRQRDGVFAQHGTALAQLEAVAQNPDAAPSLGGAPADLAMPQRARELTNWLVHIGMAETLSSAARIG